MAFDSTRAVKIAPRPAIPIDTPTCLKVLLMPAAMPLRAGSTTPTATCAMVGLQRPIPAPAAMKPGKSVVHPDDGVIPCMSTSPSPTRPRPTPNSTRAGTEWTRRPETAATTNDMTVNGRKRKPVWNGE